MALERDDVANFGEKHQEKQPKSGLANPARPCNDAGIHAEPNTVNANASPTSCPITVKESQIKCDGQIVTHERSTRP